MIRNDVRTLLMDNWKRGISLWVKNDRIHCSAPESALSEELRGALRAPSEELLAALRPPRFTPRARGSWKVQLPDYELEWWNEVRDSGLFANETHAVARVHGGVRSQILQETLNAVIGRHDLLRARLSISEGRPCLTFDGDGKSPVIVRDAPRDDISEADIIKEMVWTPFADGAVFRAFIIAMPQGTHIVGFVLHHFVADTWSSGVLFREFLTEIHRRAAGDRSPLERPFQFPDYLLGLNDWLAKGGPDARLGYWRDNLRSAPPVRLPEDFDADPELIAPVHTEEFRVPSAVRARMVKVAAAAHVMPLTVVLAAKFVALFRVLRQGDLVVTPVLASRDDPSLRQMVGNTVNMLPMRVCVTGGMTFADLVSRVDEARALAERNQAPWRMILREMDAAGASRISPVLNYFPLVGPFPPRVSLVIGEKEVLIEGLSVEMPQEMARVSAQPGHELFLLDDGREILGTMKYMPVRYRRETVRDFIEVFKDSLERATADPVSRIGETLTQA